MAYDMSAASSPSLASSVEMSMTAETRRRQAAASAGRSRGARVVACGRRPQPASARLLNDVTNECACVPFTGMSNILPASTLLVPSNPPEMTLPLQYLNEALLVMLGRCQKHELDD